MLRHQASLPRLPVPPLAATADKYLRSVRPLATASEHAETRRLVADFVKPGGEGEVLQRLLEERAQREPKGWLADWWNHAAYLDYRDPVVINVSFFFGFARDARRTGQAQRAAALTVEALRFRQQIDDETLAPEMMGKTPVCMTQYGNLFAGCRIPQPKRDAFVTYPREQSRHIVVLVRNRFFAVDVYDARGQILSAATIEALLAQVQRLAAELQARHGDAPNIGVLSADHRDTWTDNRRVLAALPGNGALLETIQSAAFAVCLDESSPRSHSELTAALWHNKGQNRFYDKNFNIIVFANGEAGVFCDHTAVDGMPPRQLFHTMLEKLAAGPVDTSAPASAPAPRHLAFTTDPDLAARIERSQAACHRVVDSAGFSYAEGPFGKSVMKKAQMSPDAFVQLAIQLGYAKMYGKQAATYESASTRKFAHGRTEVIRSLSPEAHAFCAKMFDPAATAEQRAAAMRAAAAAHSKYTRECVNAHGCDRHLYGLKRIAALAGRPTHPLFDDPVFARSTTWLLSTSQVSGEHFQYYGWGAVHPHGYGIAYNVLPNVIRFHVSNFVASPFTDAARLTASIRAAMAEMRQAVEAAGPAKAKL